MLLRAPPRGGQRISPTCTTRRAFLRALSLPLLLPLPSLARPEGVNRPDLLPATPTPVLDLERFLSRGQEAALVRSLDSLEARTGFKIRVLTQRYPVTPGLAIRDFWGVDGRTVVLVADFFTGGGSFLHFSVGEEVDRLLAPRFWSLLSERYGNKFFVERNGEDSAILEAVDSVRECLLSGGCRAPPRDAKEVLAGGGGR